jgi:hypothetical protein
MSFKALKSGTNKIHFRLKYMQAVGLATGDEFLAPFNLTIDLSDVLDYMWNLTPVWKDHLYRSDANFDDKYSINFAIVPWSKGLCYNFNLPEAENLLNLERFELLYWIEPLTNQTSR